MGLNPLNIGRAVEGVGNAVSGVVGTIWGDEKAREQQSHDAFMASVGQHGQEFRNVSNRTWFDALIDGLNRLPRPMLAFGTIGLFVYSMVNPVAFAARMQGLALVPEPLWWVMFAIISFYFGARELAYKRKMKLASSREQVQTVVDNIKTIRALEPGLEPGVAGMDDEEFERAMADTDEPLSNEAILEWNRRRGNL